MSDNSLQSMPPPEQPVPQYPAYYQPQPPEVSSMPPSLDYSQQGPSAGYPSAPPASMYPPPA
jgi:hypothetical protein